MLNYTKDSLSTFVHALAQPTRFLDWIDHSIPMDNLDLNTKTKDHFWQESFLWAWGFKCLGAVLEFMTLCFFIQFLKESNLGFSSFDFFLSQSDYLASYSLAFVFLAFSLLSFPIGIISNNLTILLSLKITLGLIDGRKTSHLKLWESIGLSNTSYFYHLVPFLGGFAQRIAQFVLLYSMVRWKFKWSKAKSILVLIAPSLVFYTSLFLILIIFFII